MKPHRTSTTSTTSSKGRSARSSAKGAGRQASSSPAPKSSRIAGLLEMVSDGFVAFDREMNYTYVNRRGAELLGRSPEELTGKNYWEEYPEARGTPFANAYLQALESQRPLQFESYYAPWDRWFENRVYPSEEGLSIFFHDITDRKKAELGLREVQERLALAVHSANIGLWDWDLVTNQVYYSAEWKSQLGYEDHELSNDFTEWQSRVHPDDLQHALTTVRRYIESPYPNFQNEFRMRHRDGAYRWILARASVVADEQGKAIRMIGSHIDITERREAEELIRNERNFSATALDSLPGIFYMYDENRKFLRWNRNFEKVAGYTAEEIARMNPLDFFSENERGLVAQRIEEVFGTGESHVEADFVSKDGTHTPYYFTGRIIEIGGRPCLIGVGIDITERKRAEEGWRRNEQVLRLFVEYSPAAIAMFDREMRYIVASRRYLRDYELGEQELTGRSHYDVFPEIPQRWKEIHRRCLAGRIEKAEEDPFRRKDGRTDWVRWEVHPWYRRQDEIGGIILFSEVITERKQTQDDLRLHRDRLAELSRRLVEVHETERRAIGRELHDQIGQMLTALSLTLEILPQVPAERSARKLGDAHMLVHDLASRVSQLSLELRPPMLDDLGLIPALLWQTNRYAEQSHIEVDFKHSGAEGRRFDPTIETTAYRLIQEALTNTARHAKAAHVRLDVRAGDTAMEIRIEDDGRGFDLQKALEKHRGLAGMRERADLVGGALHLETQPGKGTRLFIELPLKDGLP